jgi:hypothetical protein
LHGYGNLIAAWGADVVVSLNTRVERINWSGTLTTDSCCSCSLSNQGKYFQSFADRYVDECVPASV